MTTEQKFITVDGIQVPLEGERNLLSVIRKAGIDIPTFCYNPDLSVFGACRLCIVDIQGRGINSSCSTPPEAGMVIRTNTEELRNIRKITVELLLAGHDNACTTCVKSKDCSLREIARKLGVDEIRFKSTYTKKDRDTSSVSVIRDANKCILCGNCVRACAEFQTIGAIDFAGRGSHSRIAAAFGEGLGLSKCVGCGNCVTVCPVGALKVNSQIEDISKAIGDPNKVVVAAVAPAVRFGLGDVFGMPQDANVTPQMVTALKRVGFDHVYDISYAADLTIFEEAEEFIGRKTKGEKLPLFTSCCPAWVKFAEQFYPQLLNNLSSAKSPMEMFGTVARRILPELLNVAPENLVVVGVMPCTAKKGEAKLEKFKEDGRQPIDYILTTTGLGLMIEEKGLNFPKLAGSEFDMPLGMRTSAGEIFAASGGVTEAAVRYAVEKITGQKQPNYEYKELRGDAGVREVEYTVNDLKIKLAVVSGLANARKVCEDAVAGKSSYDMIEVMTCYGGCINGGGQPVAADKEARAKRAKAVYETDRTLQFQKSQDNAAVKELYAKLYEKPNSPKAHHDLHTHYDDRLTLCGAGFEALKADGTLLKVGVVCAEGMRNADVRLQVAKLADYVEGKGLQITFCPAFAEAVKAEDKLAAVVNDKVCSLSEAKAAIDAAL